MIPGTTGKSSYGEGVVYLSRRRPCSWVNLISSNNDMKSIVGGIVFTQCWPPLWRHLRAQWLSCPNKWLCTLQGFGSKSTLQTLHNNRRMPSMMLRTTRPTSRSNSSVYSMGGWINMPVDIAFCTISSGSWLRVELFCFACCNLKWDWRLSLHSNVLVQQLTGQGNLSSVDWWTIIQPVTIWILQVDQCTYRRRPSCWWEIVKKMSHSGHLKLAMNISW
jgi:hypothetical protein